MELPNASLDAELEDCEAPLICVSIALYEAQEEEEVEQGTYEQLDDELDILADKE